MDEAIFKDGSSWFYSEDPSYFIPETSRLVEILPVQLFSLRVEIVMASISI